MRQRIIHRQPLRRDLETTLPQKRRDFLRFQSYTHNFSSSLTNNHSSLRFILNKNAPSVKKVHLFIFFIPQS
jgi:hypothetical protein